MNNSRMTLRQLVNAYMNYNGTVYITTLEHVKDAEEPYCFANDDSKEFKIELTNALKSFSGLMNTEVFELYIINNEPVAVLDIPAEWLEHTEG